MGNSLSNCFAGVKKGPGSQPDAARYDDRQSVATYKEALLIDRPRAGSFIPTPRHFSSPVPRNGSTPTTDGPGQLDAIVDDFSLDDCFAEGQMQLDTDAPMKRFMDLDHMDASTGFKRQYSPGKYESEQLLASPGTLPKPMSSDEREAMIRRLPPTATFQMMSKVPKTLLSGPGAAGAEAQDLRRKLCKGSTIVFISAGLPGKRFTFERAAELGVKSVVIDHKDSWSASLVGEGVIAKFLPIDMAQSSEDIFAQALNLIKTLSDDGVTGEADAIASFVELSIPLVARLCESLGLPGHLPSAVDSARDKHQTRACLKAAGLPTPRNILIRSKAEVGAAGKHVGFPAVLKPVSGAASLGVKKVCTMRELEDYYVEVVKELSSLVISSGALIKGDPASTGGVNASANIDLTVLLEQYLDGPEVDVDVVMSEGEWRYAAVSDNGPTMEPYFNETWAVAPSLLPKDQQTALRDLAVSSTKCLGFSAGVFHVECKYTSTGPQLIEVNCRMGGGQVHECNYRTWGVDMVEETLFAALGIPARPMVPKKPLTAVAYCYVNASKSGSVKDLLGLYSLRRRQGVIWAKPLTKLGAQVVGPDTGMPTWLCDLLVEKKEPQEALDYLLSLMKEDPVKVA